MKLKLILISVLLALNTSIAFGQAGFPTPPYTEQVISNACGLPRGQCSAALVGSDTYIINSQGTIAARATGSSIGVTSGFDVTYPLPAIITPLTAYPTPASATPLNARYNIVAASGPTAMFQIYPQATTLPANVRGFGIFNQSANPVALVPYPGDTFNVSAAATPFSCTTLKYCECLKLSATNWGCTIQ